MIDRRQQQEQVAQVPEWDLVVIGGGITGAGILREAVRRGYRVLLVEQQDFAWGTSSRSSKMVHGGLRYLGSGQFGLTRDAVRERERMLREVPGLVDNLYYLMPHFRKQFPGPKLFNLLLWVYDLIARRRTRRFYSLETLLQWLPGLTREQVVGGTRFSDAITEDSRLVLRLLHEAIDEGGAALNYTRAADVSRVQGDGFEVILEDADSGDQRSVRARSVISATGAWTDELRQKLGADRVIRPLRGSHLIVPFWRLPVSVSVSMFHPDDRRAMFVFPWEGVSVIGTTDLDHKHDLSREAVIESEEVDYLLKAVNRMFPSAHLDTSDVMATWSGVRPVVSSGNNSLSPSKESREHEIWDDQGLVSVAGGKLTTFRLIALEVLEKAEEYLPEAPRQWRDRDRVFSRAPSLTRPVEVSSRQWHRLQGRYGPKLPEVLAAGPLTAVGTTDTLWAELVWSARHEAIVHLDDLLLRRTRLGMLLPDAGQAWWPEIRRLCQPELGWSDAHWEQEEQRYHRVWQQAYSLPEALQESGHE